MSLIGDDATLNDAALAAALQAGPVTLEPGVYRLGQALTHQGSLHLRGTPGRSILRFVGPTAGLRVELSDPMAEQVQIAGVTLTTMSDAPTGLAIVQDVPMGSGIERAVILRELEIRPDARLSGGAFTTGIQLHHLWFPVLDTVTVHHRPGPIIPGSVGIRCTGRTIGTAIQRGLITAMEIGIALSDDGEAIRISDTECLAVAYGFVQSSTRSGPPPVGWLSQFHAAAIRRGVIVWYGSSLLCTNSSVYRWTSAPGEFVGFQCYGGGARQSFTGCEVLNTAPQYSGPTYGFVSDGPSTRFVGCVAEGVDLAYALQGAATTTSRIVGCVP